MSSLCTSKGIFPNQGRELLIFSGTVKRWAHPFAKTGRRVHFCVRTAIRRSLVRDLCGKILAS